MASKVVDEINDIDPGFFTQNPVLLFQLKQVKPFNGIVLVCRTSSSR
jgi:hypothetical protein